MVLKDWKKSSKYNKKVYTIYSNILPQYKSFEDNYYLVIGFAGRSLLDKPFVEVIKEGSAKSKVFNTYDEALEYAENYMKTH